MKNFGRINETFKNILADSIISKDTKGKKIFNKYFKALKESSVLRTLYQVHNNLETRVEENKERTSLYVNESIDLLKELGVDEILSETKRLVNFLNKNGFSITDEDYKFKDLHENISFLVLTKKTSKNLGSIIESKEAINAHVNNNVELIKEDVEFFNPKVVGPMLVEKFNQKYSDLSENEKVAVKIITRGTEEEKELLYHNTITECIDLIDNQLTECTIEVKDKLLQVKDKLLRFKYNKEDFGSEMSKIVSLKENLV